MDTSAENRINCSIIIAHKNLPDLLVRCLDSIPARDDIQVIVIDDNSDPAIVSFDRFPQWKGKHYCTLFTKEGRGAGYARNVGLDHAQGKWVTFLDADDFFSEEFPSFLDRVVDAEEDLIIFDHRSVLENDPSVSVSRSDYLTKLIHDYNNHLIDENRIRCQYIAGACKLIRKDLIDKYHIRGHETRWSNDNYFSAQVACYAKSIRVCEDVIYVMSVREQSLTSNFCGTREEAMTRLQEAVACDKLFKEHGISTGDELTNIVLRAIHKRHSYWECVGYCLASVSNGPVFKTMARSLRRKTVNHFRKMFK